MLKQLNRTYVHYSYPKLTGKQKHSLCRIKCESVDGNFDNRHIKVRSNKCGRIPSFVSTYFFTVFPVFWIPKVPVQTLTTYFIQRIFARIRKLRPPFLYSGICTVHCGSRKTPNVTIDIVSALSSLDRYRWPCHSQKNNTSMLLVP